MEKCFNTSKSQTRKMHKKKIRRKWKETILTAETEGTNEENTLCYSINIPFLKCD